MVTRRSLSSHRMAQGSGRARESKKQLTTPTPKVKGEHLSDDDDSLQKQIRAAVKQALQVKQQGQESKGGKAEDGGAN